MKRFFLFAPATILLAAFAIAFAVYVLRCLTGRAPALRNVKHNVVLGPFFARFFVWMLGPLERMLLGRVSPNAITVCSLALCALTGVAVALGELTAAVWLYTFAGALDVLDGRLARSSGRQTAAGALLDSVSDRWGELVVFTGYLWLLRGSPWQLAVMSALAGSMMVSYTRARAEALGVALTGGVMQRAERIVLVVGGTLIAAWVAGDGDAALAGAPILGVTMAACGAASIATAGHRAHQAYRALVRRADASGPGLGALPPALAAPPRMLTPPALRKVAPIEPVEQH